MSNGTRKQNKRRSVLVDFYNLPLTGNARKDKQEILKFFGRYAPEVARQDISDVISQGYTLSDDPKPATVLSINKDSPITIGTLGVFDFFQDKSWLDSSDTRNFYGLYRLIHRVVDNYLGEKQIPRDLFQKVSELTDNISIGLIAVSSEGERLGSATIPKSFNRSEYSFNETITMQTGMVISVDGHITSPLNLGGMKLRLFRDILELWNGEIKLQKCTFAGSTRNPPCKNVFLVGNRKRYCSKKCYDKARRYRRFDKYRV